MTKDLIKEIKVTFHAKLWKQNLDCTKYSESNLEELFIDLLNGDFEKIKAENTPYFFDLKSPLYVEDCLIQSIDEKWREM
jgi:hypothetical protein